tara:strand:- start:73341 stop:74786 length:1446 start_codon:yes stop_codon:yes gene_type:complete
MTVGLIIAIISSYFLLLILVSYLTGKKDDNASFFLGNKQSPWYVVAFGMIGASLSGVTFVSVPGYVEANSFSYMQVVLGYVFGYAVIIKVLLPLYYRLNLTSIYTYLSQRFGNSSYKTGSVFFILSRVIGASFRLYLVADILQYAVFDQLEVPFWFTVLITILLIWVYTFRSGIKTIVWTDTLQTTFMLAAVGISIWMIKDSLIPDGSLVEYIADSSKSKIFFFDDWKSADFFIKQFLSGMFITIVMTGLDQDMMQKNLSCRNLKDAQKNMFWLAIILVFVNLIFMSLGVVLYDFAAVNGIEESGDRLFSAVALHGGLGITLGVFFLIGLVAAAYSSADSALTALTTSFCVDILEVDKMKERSAISTRKWVHIGFSICLLFTILIFKQLDQGSIIKEIFVAAGYTYGPLLGLFAFGLFTKWKIEDRWVPIIAIASPLLCYFLKQNSMDWLGYQFGFELLILNGLLTFLGLCLLIRKEESKI